MSGIEIAAVILWAAHIIYALYLIWSGFKESNLYKQIGGILVTLDPLLCVAVAGVHMYLIGNESKREGVE